MKLEILTQSLQHWHKESGIQHEWKTNSPYQAWVVETILQQTRIAQETPTSTDFYNAFLMCLVLPKPQSMTY